MKKEWHGYLFIAPLLLGCLVFTGIPFVLVMRYSVFHGAGVHLPFGGVQNYAQALQNSSFVLGFGNSMRFLAAGLPLTSFGRDKKKFRDYLLRDGKPVCFRYEGRDYTVHLTDVMLFPQGYAAVLTQTELLDEPSVIVADIGGWTVDLMRLDNRIPNAATCRSLELGMIRCLDEIGEKVRQMFGVSMTDAQIEGILRGGAVSVDDRIRAVIHTQAGQYVQDLLSAIMESGLDVRAMPAIFLGGGAALLKRHVSATEGPCRPLILDDVCLNAKGYERLVERMTGSAAHGQ